MLYSVEFADELLEVSFPEMCFIFYDNCLGDSKLSKNISFLEEEDVLSCDFGYGLGFYPFRKIVYPYYEVLLLVRSYHEWSGDVHAPTMKMAIGMTWS